jgi:glutaredoxin
MEIKQVDGKDKGDVMLYALSTCVWCKKTKKLLNKLGIGYQYIDVDLLNSSDKKEVEAEVKRWNPRGSYPTIVIDKKMCIPGYKEDTITELLG